MEQIKVGNKYAAASLFTWPDGTNAYTEFVVVAVDETHAVVETIDGSKIDKQKRTTLSLKLILKRCVLLNAAGSPRPEQVVNIVRTIVKRTEVFLSEYNETWADRLYNWYCDRLGRTRPEPQEITIDENAEEDMRDDECSL